MLINKRLMDQQFLYFGVSPSLLICLLVSLCAALVYLQFKSNETKRQYTFFASLYEGIDISNSNSVNRISDAILVSTDYYSIALVDTKHNTIFSRGSPLGESIEDRAINEQQKWHTKSNTFFLIPIQYIDNAQPYLGAVIIKTSTNGKQLWLYQSIIFIFLLCTIMLVSVKCGLRQLKSKIIGPMKTISDNIEAIQNKQYKKKITADQNSIFSPLALALRNLTIDLDAENENFKKTIDQSVKDLRETLETVEIQNIELDLARKSAVKANQAKSEFLANTSHEIRTPINGIVGFANLMRKTPLNDTQRDYIDTIEESAKALLLNINDVIDYSRLEVGKLNLDYKPVHIREMLDESHKIVFTNEAFDKHAILTKIDNDIPTKLLGDPLRIKQVYNSLLSNAIELCQPRNITTSVAIQGQNENLLTLKIAISVPATERCKNIDITRAQQILNMQEPERQDLSNKNQMGLVISKGLVKRMQGQLGIATSARDTVFWFTFQLGQPNQVSSSSITEIAENTVLVVDDNASNRLLVCEFLSDMGIKTESAASGEEAIDFFKEKSFSLILMDIQMPGLNGFETTKYIRDMEQGSQRIPIVALTAHAVEEEKLTLLKSGMDDFLSKPITEVELKELLSRWVQYSPSQKKQPVDKQQNQTNTKKQPADSIKQPVDISSCLQRAKGKRDLAKDMLEMLLASLHNELSDIESHWQSKNYESLYEVVHRIHGGACYSGVPRLLATSANLDNKLKRKQYADCEEHVSELITSCKELVDWKEEHDLDVLFSEEA